MTFLATILTNWKLILLGSALAGVLVLSMLLKVVTAQKELAIQDLANYKQAVAAAQLAAKAQSDHALKEAKRDYEIQKAAVEKAAWANAKARFWSCNAAGGIRLDGLLTGDKVRDGEASVSERSVRLQEQERVALGRDDIEDYARCIAVTKSMQKWVTDVGLELK